MSRTRRREGNEESNNAPTSEETVDGVTSLFEGNTDGVTSLFSEGVVPLFNEFQMRNSLMEDRYAVRVNEDISWNERNGWATLSLADAFTSTSRVINTEEPRFSIAIIEFTDGSERMTIIEVEEMISDDPEFMSFTSLTPGRPATMVRKSVIKSIEWRATVNWGNVNWGNNE